MIETSPGRLVEKHTRSYHHVSNNAKEYCKNCSFLQDKVEKMEGLLHVSLKLLEQ
jgi:hypothetical protein